jgi:hypothetical protein
VDELKASGKPFQVSKQEVWDAWLKVKGNKGAPGVDGQSIGEPRRACSGVSPGRVEGPVTARSGRGALGAGRSCLADGQTVVATRSGLHLVPDLVGRSQEVGDDGDHLLIRPAEAWPGYRQRSHDPVITIEDGNSECRDASG